MRECDLCPRSCGVDRNVSKGYCGHGLLPVIGRVAPHMWEEPCISGERGSGTVFFCGCTLGCVYCQNFRISGGREKIGREVDENGLCGIFLELEKMAVHNINLVTPTMFVPVIANAIEAARELGMALPIVYNTSGYEKLSTLELMDGKIDVYLPDFKYITPETAQRYSMASDYPVHASKSLEYMVKKLGRAVFSDDGMMRRGVVVRHLLLPGQLAESKRVLDFLFALYGNDIYYSLMCQYTPTAGLDTKKYPELARRVTTYEYNKLIDHALTLGIKNGFTQEREAARESFIPEFGMQRE